MTAAPSWSSLSVPRPLPELVVTPTTAQLFMFSAVTWNRHRIHYDHHAAVEEGHPGVVVQRALLGNFLARLLTGWLQDRGEVRELSWRVLKSAVPVEILPEGEPA
jgi:hydroxyacyl-ACP dehydratase HTD2-like protein with hotdog domain